MSTEEMARQNIADQRQHLQNLQQTMRERSEAERADDLRMQARTRESLAEQRHKERQATLSMQSRAEEEIGLTKADNQPA